MEKEQAAEAFAQMLYNVGVVGAYEMFFEGMESTFGHEKVKWQKIRDWYTSKDSEEQQLVNTILKEVLTASAFHLAVRFDGAAGYEEFDDKIGEFAVSLRLYDDPEDVDAEVMTPLQSIGICPTESGEMIHDIFMNLVDEAEKV